MDAKQIIDYAAEDNAKDFREALYASIYDKINSHIETMKQGIAHNLVTQEAKECDDEDDKEEEDDDDKKKKEDLEEGTMTGITLGKQIKNKQGGYNQDVHHNGKKIGHIEAYSHRTGMRYGSHHDATGDATAGNRSPEESIADIRWSHAQHLKSMKEEVEQIDEVSKETLKSYVKKASVDAGTDQLKMIRRHKGDTVKTGRVEAGKNFRNIGKQRSAGISKALDKLAK